MPERLLVEDYRSFDRTIGMEAVLSINAIVTNMRMPYSELEAQNREGALAPHIGSYLLRAEETFEVTEPIYNAFLDKPPQQRSRWGRADKAITMDYSV